jgi:hypothetical protein
VLGLLLQYLIQSCARGWRRIVEDMCYDDVFYLFLQGYWLDFFFAEFPLKVCVCLLLQDLVQNCLRRGWGGGEGGRSQGVCVYYCRT